MKQYNQFDSAWKDILDSCFKQFVEFCLPNLYAQIDWAKGVMSLDKELQIIVKSGLAGTRFVDKLLKIFLITGEEKWILVHVEVQNTRDGEFPQRMLIYNYRLYDKYQKPILSCAILTDNQEHWRPDYYETGFYGSKLSLKFLVIKLVDYRGKERELEESNNIFASVILTHLSAMEIKNYSNEERLKTKYNLTRRLYKKRFTKEQVIQLYFFLDRVIKLPESLEIKYNECVYQLEEDIKMPYVSSMERMFIRKGLKQGIQQGEINILFRLLNRKFGSVSPSLEHRLKDADPETLLLWADKVLDAKTLEDVFTK